MSNASLVLHKGARLVTRAELDTYSAPPPTSSWFPLPHHQVLQTSISILDHAGFRVIRQQLAVSRDAAQFFGTLDLATKINDGTTLAVGLRNSTDKSLPIGFCAGSRTFVCDNLAFSSEILVVRKHTKFGEVRFNEGIAASVRQLHQYVGMEAQRIAWMQETTVTEDQADALILRAYEQEIVGARTLPNLIKEWRTPSHDEFRPRNLYSLLNAFTEVLKDRQKSQPARAAAETIKLQSLLTGPFATSA